MHPSRHHATPPDHRRGVLLALLLATLPLSACGGLVAERPEIGDFIDEMVHKHAFERPALVALFNQVKLRPRVVTAAASPAEREPFFKYRKRFVNEQRIAAGADYWRQHAALLEAAEARFGVSAGVIVAILGVETRYGSYTGKHRVIDALATLTFEQRARADFYRRELEQFLLLSREEAIDPRTAMGSYAGAMGHGQFISSSYRHYAVDFDGDGRRDLWSPADAIGSVANYLARHGWVLGEPAVLTARIAGNGHHTLLERGIDPQTPLAEFAAHGVTVDSIGDATRKAALIRLETGQGPAYWAALNNFRVVTRYNHSPRYAMAVLQLEAAIRDRLR